MAEDRHEPKPLPLQHVTDAIERLNFEVRTEAQDAGEINPLELLQRNKVMAIEIKTIREFMLDALCADGEGAIDYVQRHAVAEEFFGRLANQLHSEASRLATKPKVKVHSKVNGSGK